MENYRISDLAKTFGKSRQTIAYQIQSNLQEKVDYQKTLVKGKELLLINAKGYAKLRKYYFPNLEKENNLDITSDQRYINTLENQLKEKDRQILTLQESLKNTQQLANQAQQLQLQAEATQKELQGQLKTALTGDLRSTNTNKGNYAKAEVKRPQRANRSIWQRLFNKQ